MHVALMVCHCNIGTDTGLIAPHFSSGSSGDLRVSFTALSLLDVQHSVTARARVVGVLKLVHEEGNEAAAQHQPEADEEQAHEPGVSSGLVGDVGHDLLLAGGAGRHAGVKAQRRVVAHKLLTFGIRVRGPRVQTSCVHWELCGVTLWRIERSVDMINLDSASTAFLTVHWHHIRRCILPSVRTHWAALLSCLCLSAVLEFGVVFF